VPDSRIPPAVRPIRRLGPGDGDDDAAYEFIVGPLLDNPHRVGKQLRPPLDDRYSARRGTYRVIFRIDDSSHTVTVVDVAHRRDAYRP
jgi:mRNA interferase RelE/StbE